MSGFVLIARLKRKQCREVLYTKHHPTYAFRSKDSNRTNKPTK